jgi:hypothetical protein
LDEGRRGSIHIKKIYFDPKISFGQKWVVYAFFTQKCEIFLEIFLKQNIKFKKKWKTPKKNMIFQQQKTTKNIIFFRNYIFQRTTFHMQLFW